jgi:hypothetical protein
MDGGVGTVSSLERSKRDLRMSVHGRLEEEGLEWSSEAEAGGLMMSRDIKRLNPQNEGKTCLRCNVVAPWRGVDRASLARTAYRLQHPPLHHNHS